MAAANAGDRSKSDQLLREVENVSHTIMEKLEDTRGEYLSKL